MKKIIVLTDLLISPIQAGLISHKGCDRLNIFIILEFILSIVGLYAFIRYGDFRPNMVFVAYLLIKSIYQAVQLHKKKKNDDAHK